MRKAYFRAFHLRPKVGAFKRISRKSKPLQMFDRIAISIRLVKGAYWDYETVTDKQNEFSEYIKNLSRKYIH